MKLIDPKSNGEVVHCTALEARLNKYSYKITEKSDIDKIEWKDKPLTKIIVAL